jgi:hypothetical protein
MSRRIVSPEFYSVDGLCSKSLFKDEVFEDFNGELWVLDLLTNRQVKVIELLPTRAPEGSICKVREPRNGKIDLVTYRRVCGCWIKIPESIVGDK